MVKPRGASANMVTKPLTRERNESAYRILSPAAGTGLNRLWCGRKDSDPGCSPDAHIQSGSDAWATGAKLRR